ncbi:hypothetical protein Zmor_000398 [Zophobas morio]|uniref:acid phosphatase n=1 Tax=Zophobas morio TaxID=2755281 RepID=A0AA38IW30_9CUCU|nr:hypothetical protein Zmor_000398 [Zophobas morio]
MVVKVHIRGILKSEKPYLEDHWCQFDASMVFFLWISVDLISVRNSGHSPRHGNRTPDRTSLFPNDPNVNETYEPFGYSQLTTKGKKTQYEIGRYLRETYGDFIPAQYTPDAVYAISTNFKRTKMCLELVLAGLFPPLESDIFTESLNWQPIPFNVEQQEELIGIPLIYCSNFVRQYYKFMLSLEGKEMLDSYQNLYQQLSNYSGLAVTSPDEVLDVFETLESEQYYGLELLEWTSEILTTGKFLIKILDVSVITILFVFSRFIKLLTIPDCTSFCEIDKFAEQIADDFPGMADICTFTGELM